MSQHLHHHLKLHHLHFTEINALYTSLSLQAFSVGLIGIFVPIYFYNLNFSLFEIAVFFIIMSIFTLLCFPIVAPHVLKRGPKHIIMVSFVIMFFYFALLSILPAQKNLLYLIAVVAGISEGVFWTARHMDLAMVLTKDKAASEFSTLLIFSTIAQAAAPLVGGVIASTFGIQYTLLGTTVGLLIALYPLLSTPEPVLPHKKISFRILNTAPTRHLVANFAANAQSVVGVFLWPFFIYLVVKTYQTVGIIASLSLFLVVVLLYMMGRFRDKKSENRMLAVGSSIRGVGHVTRALSRTFPTALGSSIIGDVGDTIVCIPYAVYFYSETKKRNTPAYLTDMEIAACMGKILPWLVLVVVAGFTNIEIAFMITLFFAALLMPFVHLIEPVGNSE